MEAVEVGGVDAPLGEVPRGLGWQAGGVDAPFGGDDPAEGLGVIAADTVEVDAEDVLVGHGGQTTGAGLARSPRTTSSTSKLLGVEK